MIKRRLHLQIYFTIIASLVLVVVVTTGLFALSGSEKIDRQVFNMTARLAWMALPPATTSNEEQTDALKKLGADFNIGLTLFDKEGNLIGANRTPSPPPELDEDDNDENGWHRISRGPTWMIRLPDRRWFSVNLMRNDRRNPIVGLLFLLAGITLAIGLASYPFVKRLTGRLDRLQSGVEKIGEGDLTTRVEVEGKDEIAALAKSFNHSADTIEKLVASNKQLLAHASHELRTPLARIRLGVEMMKEAPTAKRQAALEADIGELDALIDEILLMSRLDAGKNTLMGAPLDLLALVAEECSHYDGCELTGTPTEINGDARLLRRLVRNLLDNAYKHGAPPVSVEVRLNRNQVVLTVQDSGSGIPDHQKEDVLKPFYRAPGKQNVPGYGLGLSLVSQIVRAHGGSLEIGTNETQKDEQGMVVTVELPTHTLT